MHTTKSLKDKKKNHIVFSYNKTSKNICFSMHFGFNNQFIKVMRTRLIFQKYPKNILFSCIRPSLSKIERKKSYRFYTENIKKI